MRKKHRKLGYSPKQRANEYRRMWKKNKDVEQIAERMLPTDTKLYYDIGKDALRSVEKKTIELIKEGMKPKKAWKEAKKDVLGLNLRWIPMTSSSFRPVAKPPQYILSNPITKTLQIRGISEQKLDRLISEYKRNLGVDEIKKMDGRVADYLESAMESMTKGKAPKRMKFSKEDKILSELFKKYKISDSKVRSQIRFMLPLFTSVDIEMSKIRGGEIKPFDNYFYSAHNVFKSRTTKTIKLMEQRNNLHEHAHNILALALLKRRKSVSDWKRELFSYALSVIAQTKQLAESRVKADNWKVESPENRKEFFRIKKMEESEAFEMFPGTGIGMSGKPHLKAKNVIDSLLDLDARTITERGPLLIRKIVFDGRIRTPEQAIRYLKKHG